MPGGEERGLFPYGHRPTRDGRHREDHSAQNGRARPERDDRQPFSRHGDDRRQSNHPPDNRYRDSRYKDNRQQNGHQRNGHPDRERRPADRRPSDRRPDDRRPSDRRPDNRRHDERRHDDRRHDDNPPAMSAPRRATGRYDHELVTPTTAIRHNDRDRGQPRSESGSGSERTGEPPVWSWMALILSVISMTLFASLLGVFGMLFASLAYSDHKLGDYKRAKYKTRWSWFCSALGIILTVTSLVLLIILMHAVKTSRPTFAHYEYWLPPWLVDALSDDSN